jgi:hypothetical protein
MLTKISFFLLISNNSSGWPKNLRSGTLLEPISIQMRNTPCTALCIDPGQFLSDKTLKEKRKNQKLGNAKKTVTVGAKIDPYPFHLVQYVSVIFMTNLDSTFQDQKLPMAKHVLRQKSRKITGLFNELLKFQKMCSSPIQSTHRKLPYFVPLFAVRGFLKIQIGL